ncbi:hypothetical protein HNQ44_000062 [Planomicrobium koreense]|uniref:Uncharacterized protein n=1 Tax=Planococcus koreensis TaxID=112331 RepID=A0A7W8CRG0_9BACL|nr:MULTISPECIES: hypothetical protein [Planococcus]MBB5178640.1 hypothetical protein [Planococcus koreensis]MDN3450924.1 hypothetical protein [Planococcus sp. APC 3906]
MPVTPTAILDSLAAAEKSGVDMGSPKAVVDFMLAQGERQSILYFYKPNSVEFDFDKFEGIVKEMRTRKEQ